jgi:2',3'-cyclic-nucleotide 2'-phosphodiesterase/3'-nucleotidase
MTWDSKNLEGKAQTRDIVDAAKAWVPAMKEDGADIVIALSHSGIDGSGLSDRMENASLYLAAVEGIDAIFTGHSIWSFPAQRTLKASPGRTPEPAN